MNLIIRKSKAAEHGVHPTPDEHQDKLVGAAAFLGSLRGLKLVPSKWYRLVPPTSG
jgi:hypothetical protein